MKPIPGYEGKYSITECGEIYSHISSKWLNPQAKRGGYIRVGLLVESPKKYKYYSLHQLVLLTYKGCCPKGQEGCHIDGNKLNNNLNNLEYKTHKENMKDQYKHGTRASGSRKLTKEIADNIRKERKTKTIQELSDKYKVSTRQIERICNYTRWA